MQDGVMELVQDIDARRDKLSPAYFPGDTPGNLGNRPHKQNVTGPISMENGPHARGEPSSSIVRISGIIRIHLISPMMSNTWNSIRLCERFYAPNSM
jgi:hypothetical protein